MIPALDPAEWTVIASAISLDQAELLLPGLLGTQDISSVRASARTLASLLLFDAGQDATPGLAARSALDQFPESLARWWKETIRIGTGQSPVNGILWTWSGLFWATSYADRTRRRIASMESAGLFEDMRNAASRWIPEDRWKAKRKAAGQGKRSVWDQRVRQELKGLEPLDILVEFVLEAHAALQIWRDLNVSHTRADLQEVVDWGRRQGLLDGMSEADISSPPWELIESAT